MTSVFTKVIDAIPLSAGSAESVAAVALVMASITEVPRSVPVPPALE